MGSWVEYFDRTFYPNHPAGWDDRIYMDTILEHVDEKSVVLDLGAGRGANPRLSLRGKVGKICGVDVDPAVLKNPYLDEARIIENGVIPYPEGSFDCVVSSYVLEHLEHPCEVFKEIHRVLRKGGYFISRTPNRFHYVPLIASVTPHWFHELVNRSRGREEVDTFQTFYRANAFRPIKKLCMLSGFRLIEYQQCEGRPEYMRFNLITYTAGMIYERVCSFTEMFGFLRPLIVCVLRK